MDESTKRDTDATEDAQGAKAAEDRNAAAQAEGAPAVEKEKAATGAAPASAADGDKAAAPEADPKEADADPAADAAAEAEVPAHGAHAAPAASSKRNVIIGTVAAVCVVVACGVGFVLASGPSEPAPTAPATEEEAVEQAAEQLAENPIDWAEMAELNDNIYAWIRVPDTNVDLPVFQHPLAENWYLAHDREGNDSREGELYTQGTHNSKDFTADPVTVMYGHTFEDIDSMFTTLHNYEDPAFFESHPYFYVYTPDSILTYEVLSAYETDNKLILGKWDVNDPGVQQEYFDFVANPGSDNQQLRAMAPLVSGQDHILQLSTCTKPANDSKRFIVTGVLVNVEQTAPQDAEGLAEEAAEAEDAEGQPEAA